MYRPLSLLLFALPFLSIVPAEAEVLSSAPNGFRVEHVLEIEVPPARVWDGFGEIGEWWHPDHTFSLDAGALTFDARVRGCLCESLPGGGVVHLEVVHADAPRRLVLTGGLGPLQTVPVTGTMVWTLEDLDGDSTRLTWTYGVSGYVDAGLDAWAPAVDGVLGQQVSRLASWLETGSPDPAPAESDSEGTPGSQSDSGARPEVPEEPASSGP